MHALIDHLLLGAGIQRLRELNHSLQTELARNRRLAERLLETEESVRQEVARELHDDIGQTITARYIQPVSQPPASTMPKPNSKPPITAFGPAHMILGSTPNCT